MAMTLVTVMTLSSPLCSELTTLEMWKYENLITFRFVIYRLQDFFERGKHPATIPKAGPPRNQQGGLLTS